MMDMGFGQMPPARGKGNPFMGKMMSPTRANPSMGGMMGGMMSAPRSSPSSMRGTPTGEQCVGKIRSYSQKNRYGFITSPHTKDCYFQQRELPEEVQGLDGKELVGKTVRFEVLLK